MFTILLIQVVVVVIIIIIIIIIIKELSHVWEMFWIKISTKVAKDSLYQLRVRKIFELNRPLQPKITYRSRKVRVCTEQKNPS